MLRHVPALTVALLVSPVLAGLAGTLLPAFGYLPALGGHQLTLTPWHELLATPGLGISVGVSLLVGLATTAVSLAAVVLFAASAHGTRAFGLARHALSPLLAVPHVAMATGLAFTIAPSGLMVRLFSSVAGFPDRPPDVLIPHDPLGLALMAGLVVKEIPFLFLMVLAALPQTDADRSLIVARTMGYGRMAAWLKVVLPRLYPQIRLPVLAVLAYGTSVVDVAVVLGPTTPPTLPVQILRWMNDPDLSLRYRACAGAVLQLLVTGLAMGIWIAAERLVGRALRPALTNGGRSIAERSAPIAAAAIGGLLAGLVVLAGAAIMLWAFAEIWRFPAAVPATFTLETWTTQLSRATALASNTLTIAVASAAIALALAIACLEAEVRFARRTTNRALWLLYLPLLVPQIAFLLGLQVMLVHVRLDETLAAAILVHLVFVLPYVFLSLSDPWRAFDDRFRTVGLTLGASPGRVLWAIRLPILLRAVLTAAAVGIALSVGQYLATQLVAAARWPTLTTEAVTIASGGDRRTLAVYAILQAVLPFLAFLLAIAVPSLVFRKRAALRVA